MTCFDSIFSGPGGIANQLIDNFAGTDATFSYKTEGSYDPITMTGSDVEQITFTVKITPPEPYDIDEVDGNTHQRGQMSFSVSAVGVGEYGEPPIGATVSFDGHVWRITQVSPVRSGNVVAMYIIVVAKK